MSDRLTGAIGRVRERMEQVEVNPHLIFGSTPATTADLKTIIDAAEAGILGISPKMAGLLIEAKREIDDLRRRNEVLGAKVEMIDLFALVLHSEPARRGGGVMAEDIAWKLQQAINTMEPGK